VLFDHFCDSFFFIELWHFRRTLDPRQGLPTGQVARFSIGRFCFPKKGLA
jgi:hypothetical protein